MTTTATLEPLNNQKYPFCYPPNLPPKSIDICFGTRNSSTIDCPWFCCKLWPHDDSITWTDKQKTQIINDLVPLTQHLKETHNLVSYQRDGQIEMWHVVYVAK